MSADNWTTCPACTKEQEDLTTPLREDWELGIHEGKFFVSYSASCRECGWAKHFNHEEKVP